MTTGRPDVQQRPHLRVVGRLRAGLAGRAERDQLRVLQVQLLARPAEELGVLGHRAGPAALDEAHAELVQEPGDGELVGDGVGDALALRPSRSVVSKTWKASFAWSMVCRPSPAGRERWRDVSSEQTKDPSRNARGLRTGGSSAELSQCAPAIIAGPACG